MAHNIEPMDIDVDSVFDNKENSIHHSNVYLQTPCTEKGYEELDVSELNMKLRYSVTPTTSPMSKSYTANSIDNKSVELSGDILNANLTRSYNSTLSKSDVINKSNKTLPLQPISADQFIDNNRSTSHMRPFEPSQTDNAGDITVTVTNENEDNFEIPSLTSSTANTPEVTTPTKELPRNDGGSPIMRGLKSVLNMFRSSQSPIPPPETEDSITKQILRPGDVISPDSTVQPTQSVLASTPITKENTSKRNSPLKESVIFNDDLEKELLWKDETTILFSQEKIPIHKLFYQRPLNNAVDSTKTNCGEKSIVENNLNDTVEYMDISCNDSIIKDVIKNIQSEEQQILGESDGEFVDCETTFTNDKSGMVDTSEIVNNAMLESNLASQNDLNSTVQSLEQNKFSSISNDKTSLSASFNKADDPKIALHEDVSNPTDVQQIDVEKQETYKSAVIIEELKLMSEEPMTTSNVSLQHKDNMEMNNKNEFSKTIELNLEEENTMIGSGLSLQDESIKDLPIPTVDMNKTVTEKQAVILGESVNEDTKSQAINEQSHILYNSPQSNVTSNLHVDSFQDTNIHVVPFDSEKIYCLNSSEGIVDRSPSESNPITIEMLKEQTVKLSDECTKILGIEKDSVIPANIPLPEEDYFEFEVTTSDKDDLPNKSLNITLSNINEKAFATQLESSACVETVPINSLVLAKQDENKTINVNIDENMVTDIQESNDAIILTPGNKNKDFRIVETVNDITQELKKDIDDIIRDAECIIEHQHSEIPVILDNVELKCDDDIQSKKEDTVDQNPPLVCESTLNNQNNTVLYAPQSELKDLGVELVNQSLSLEVHNEKNSDVDKEDQLLKVDKQLSEQCSPEINENNFYPENLQNNIIDDNSLPVSNENQSDSMCCKTDCSVEEKINTLTHNTVIISQVTQEINNDAKSESLPDVISDTIAYNVPDISLVECNVDTAKTNNDSAQENIAEIKTNEEILRNKGEIEVNIDEEVILSENNSPFVSIAGGVNRTEELPPLNFEDSETTFAVTTKFAPSPPISPKISSKGYNFNFDEIDDPFATKTKIRLSPPPISPKENILKIVDENISKKDTNKNRRKSQHERKNITQKNIKSKSFAEHTLKLDSETVKPLDSLPQAEASLETPIKGSNDQIILDKPEKGNQMLDIEPSLNSNQTEDKNIDTKQTENIAVNELQPEADKSSEVVTIEENKSSVESVSISNEVRNTSSSEQSTYYSAETSGEATKIRNVFNIPEIDDVNFNPFITKSKIRESPPNCNNDSNKCNDSSGQFYPADKSSEVLEDKDCVNISNTTCSSRTTDEKDITVREVHTEDEDTIEGPFLETEDLNNIDKMSDFDGEDVDMMHFSELPSQGNEEQLEGGEMFIDAEAFEFLLNQNKSNAVSDSGKESLFLKFDPLFAKRVSTDGVLTALNKIQKRQSTPKKVAQQLDITTEKSDPGPSTSDKSQKLNTNDLAGDNTDDLNVAVSKPMMVVTPAVNPIVTPRNKSTTPTSSNRRSITFTSPAIAVIDRLLSLSGNNSFLSHDSTMTQVNREQNEADRALTQLRELLAEKEIHVYNLRSESKELKDRLSTLESQMRTLETESEERLKKINDLNEKLSEKTKLNKSMAVVVEEYERTIASLIAESEQDKRRHNEERSKLVKERDEQTAHLASMEVSFSDLHSKYEKSKQVIMSCKANEDAYRKSINDFEENLSKMQSNYELLKQHATTKLNHANQELEKMNRTHEAEVLKLNAMIKRKELHITSLEETLAQKTKANEELTAICDELINKVG